MSWGTCITAGGLQKDVRKPLKETNRDAFRNPVVGEVGWGSIHVVCSRTTLVRSPSPSSILSVTASEAPEARRLVELRDRWLNPPEWVEWADEPVRGYPKRPVPPDEGAAKALKMRTLTNLYNARRQWLADAHEALDPAVAAASGWSADISNDEVVRELLALNGGGR